MEFDKSRRVYTEPEQQRLPHESFGPVLASERHEAGLSQAKLAEDADCDHSYVSRLESGVRDPSREAVESFVDAMDLQQRIADRLRASAGFRGEGNTIPYNEEELLDLLALFGEANFPGPVKEHMRDSLRLLIKMGRLAADHYVPQEVEE